MFKDRSDAGRQLGEELRRHGVKGALVLAIPRGGVEVGWKVAEALGCEFSVLVVRKLPFPDDPEAGFGAVAEDGSLCLLPGSADRLSRVQTAAVLKAQRAEVRRRIRVLRQGEPLPALRGRDVVLVDDGIAMGSTTLAAVKCCRRLGARRVTVAAPVASRRARERLAAAADELVVLLTPADFMAVADHYAHWYDVCDEEVLEIFGRARRRSVQDAGSRS